MKIKKLLAYGIILSLLLMPLGGCSGKGSPVDDEEIGTPEGVVLAYLNWFSEKNFEKIESMVFNDNAVGNVYFVPPTQPPKNPLEMIQSQYDFITHFYGDDAWENVTYELEEIVLANDGDVDIEPTKEVKADAKDETKTDVEIKEYRVNFIFQNMPLHLLGYENIHITLSNEPGAWVIKEGLSWDRNLYGGGPAPAYYKGAEAVYRGVNADTQPVDIKNQLGEPLSEQENDGDEDMPSYSLIYKDASYYFAKHIDLDGNLVRYYLESIMVTSGNYNLPRSIKLGDTFYSVMNKFPREKDWLIDPYECFYGINTLEGFGGACFSSIGEAGVSTTSVVLVPSEYTPYFKMEFTKDILESAMIVFIQM